MNFIKGLLIGALAVSIIFNQFSLAMYLALSLCAVLEFHNVQLKKK